MGANRSLLTLFKKRQDLVDPAINRSLEFNGVDSFLRMPGTIGNFPFFNTKKFANSAWIKTNVADSNDRYFSAKHNPASGDAINTTYNCSKTAANKLKFQIGVGGTFYEVVGSTTISPNSYYRVLMFCDTTEPSASDRLRITINGVLETPLSSSYPPLDATVNMTQAFDNWVGNFYTESANNNWNGNIYQHAVYDNAAVTDNDLHSGSKPIDISGVPGIISLLQTNETDALINDTTLTADWINNNGVIKSADIPGA